MRFLAGRPWQAPHMRSNLFDAANLEHAATARITMQNPAVAKVSLGPPFLARRGSMIAYQDAVDLAYEGSGMKRFLKGAATGEQLPLMRCSGTGEVFLAHGGIKLHVISLDANERISVSSQRLLGFDDTVHWDVKKIQAGAAAMVAGGLFNVTVTGPGDVLLSADWPVVLNPAEAPTFCDGNALVAWAADLQTQVKTSMKAGALIGRGSGEAVQVGFQGTGWVIVEPEYAVQ